MTSFSATLPKAGWRRRARPLLGTLVELGVPADAVPDAEDEAFAAVAAVQATLSRFEPDSDLARLQALPAGVELPLRPAARRVFRAAQALRDASGGAFDVTLGSGCFAWRCRQGRLQRDHDAVHFDLGGLAKGHALDAAVAALRRHGCVAGWINAGGDLRVFGDLALPLWLRNEDRGGVQPFATLGDGALATSRFGPGSRDRLWRAGTAAPPTPASPTTSRTTCDRCSTAPARFSVTSQPRPTGSARTTTRQTFFPT